MRSRGVVSLAQDPFRGRKREVSPEKKQIAISDAETIRDWVDRRLKELLGEEDEILTGLVLEEMKTGNLTASLQAFLGPKTEAFVQDLQEISDKLREAQKAAEKQAELLASLAELKRKIPRRTRSGSRSRSPR